MRNTQSPHKGQAESRTYNVKLNRVTKFFCSILFGGACSVFGSQQYSVQGIDNLAPFAINNTSQIVGEPQDTLVYASLWQAGGVTPIVPPGLTEPVAVGINNAGEVIGSGTDSQGWGQGFAWESDAGFINLTVPAGQAAGFAAINNAGEIGGCISVESAAGPREACIWSSQGNPTFLPDLSGSNDSVVNALNNNGQIVGTSGIASDNSWPRNPSALYGAEHAVLWANGSAIDLTPGDPWSDAVSVNDADQVIGWLINPKTSVLSAFEWDTVSGLTELTDGEHALVSAINDEGEIVGSIVDPTGVSTLAALWDNGSLYDLNSFLPNGSGWILNDATGINDSGQIVGDGTYDGQEEAFLLTPTSITSIPEPAAISLAAGFCLLAARRRK